LLLAVVWFSSVMQAAVCQAESGASSRGLLWWAVCLQVSLWRLWRMLTILQEHLLLLLLLLVEKIQ
jgi:hypothetical protein